MTWLSRLFGLLPSSPGHRGRAGVAPVLRINGQGLTMGGSSLQWDDIATVHAFKRDCYVVDQICLVFANRDGDVLIEVSENDAVYQDLLDSLPVRLPGCAAFAEWWMAVAFPAFETNLTTVYERPANHQET